MTQLPAIFLNILAPVFALVLLGYLIGPRLQIDARSVSKLAYYIFAPAFLFNVFSDATIEANLAVRMAVYGIVVAIATAIIGLLIARAMRCTAQMTAAFVLVSAFGNVGNFGFPIIQFKFGDVAIVDASVYFITLSITGFVIGVAAATWNKDGRLGAMLAIFKTPAIVAAIPAFLVNGFALPVPIFIDRAVGLLAGALIPVMLMTLGLQLANIGRITVDRDTLVASLVRLVAGPILAIALAAPFALTGTPRGAGVLQAAMPAAVLASLIALEHNLLPNFVTTVVLLSTLASALTLTIVLAIV